MTLTRSNGNSGALAKNDVLEVSYPTGTRHRFIVQEITWGGNTYLLPLIDRITDPRENTLSFEYGTDQLANDYGQIKHIRSSNGNFVGFYYDLLGRIVEVYTRSNKRFRYSYDQYGDLEYVIHPDGKRVRYEYEEGEDSNENNRVYSKHRMLRQIFPDGRILKNNYDEFGRIKYQEATVGQDLNPVVALALKYHYDSVDEDTGLATGHTVVYNANGAGNLVSFDQNGDVLSDATGSVVGAAADNSLPLGGGTRYDFVDSKIVQTTDALGKTLIQEWYSDRSEGLDIDQPGGFGESPKRIIEVFHSLSKAEFTALRQAVDKLEYIQDPSRN